MPQAATTIAASNVHTASFLIEGAYRWASEFLHGGHEPWAISH
jgi:hypothetical protein